MAQIISLTRPLPSFWTFYLLHFPFNLFPSSPFGKLGGLRLESLPLARIEKFPTNRFISPHKCGSRRGNSPHFGGGDGVDLLLTLDLLWQVCMMSGGPGGVDSSREEGAIKQEEDRFCALSDPRDLSTTRGASGGQPSSCASPSTTVLYSPSTTALTSEVSPGLGRWEGIWAPFGVVVLGGI